MENKDLRQLMDEARKVALTSEERNRLKDDLILFVKNRPERKAGLVRHYYWRSMIAFSLAAILLFIINARTTNEAVRIDRALSGADVKVTEARILLEAKKNKLDAVTASAVEEKLKAAEAAMTEARNKVGTASSSAVMVLIKTADQAAEEARANLK